MVARLTALFAVTAACLVALLLPSTAWADETPTDQPSASESESADPGGGIDPDATAISIRLLNSGGTLTPDDDKPIPEVTLTVADEAGKDVGDGVTGEDGIAVIEVPDKGTYKVTLDEDTLPDGIKLDKDTKSSLTVAVRLNGPNNRAQFPIGVVRGETSSFGDDLNGSIVSGIKFGLIVALAALGLSLIFGATGLTNFSHGELITLGGILTYLFNRDVGLPVVVAGAIAVVLSGVFGWVQDQVLWKPLRHRGTGLIAMMVVSIGLAIFLRNIYQYFFTSSTRTLSEYVSQPRKDYGIVELAQKELAIILIAIVAIVIACLALLRTRLGKAMRAVSDNPALAASSGMRVDGVISSAWILGTALTGLSGVLLAVNSQVNFAMGQKLLLLVFAAVTLGGLGTIWGALVGSLVIGLVVEVGPLFGVPSSIKEVGALVVLILVLLVRPQGILGRRERIG